HDVGALDAAAFSLGSANAVGLVILFRNRAREYFPRRHHPGLFPAIMAITVPRPNLNWRERLYLPAIAAGLAITIKHFKNMIFRRTKVTMQYPEQKWDSNLPDYYRGAPALVRDSDGRVRCVACQLCEFICP